MKFAVAYEVFDYGIALEFVEAESEIDAVRSIFPDEVKELGYFASFEDFSSEFYLKFNIEVNVKKII